MPLTWTKAVLDELKPWAEKCYPYEGCGLLLGSFEGTLKRVKRFYPLSNLLHERNKVKSGHVLQTAADSLGKRVESQGQFEFVMDPQEFNRAVLAGEKENLD